MDTLTIVKIVELINEHINELKTLPGNPVGREQAIQELVLLKKDVKALITPSK